MLPAFEVLPDKVVEYHGDAMTVLAVKDGFPVLSDFLLHCYQNLKVEKSVSLLSFFFATAHERK